MDFRVLRNLYINLGSFEFDCSFESLMEDEVIGAGYKSRKEVIRKEINEFLNSVGEMERVVKYIQHDIDFFWNGILKDIVDDEKRNNIIKSDEMTINFLENRIAELKANKSMAR